MHCFMEILLLPLVVEFCIFCSYIVSFSLPWSFRVLLFKYSFELLFEASCHSQLFVYFLDAIVPNFETQKKDCRKEKRNTIVIVIPPPRHA